MPVDIKRKRSLRESTTRSSAPKRHEPAKGVAAKNATPPEPPRPETPVEEEVVEEVPTTFDIQGPLPLSTRLQKPDELPSKEWKTIAESAVLQTAFDRSRDVWLSGKMFDKYWTKPGRKKIIDNTNPPKDSMVKVGEVMMSIHPHVFEAKLYTIRDREKEKQRDLEFQQQQEAYQAQLAQMPKYSHPGRPTNSAKAAAQGKTNGQPNGTPTPRPAQTPNGHLNGSHQTPPRNQLSPPPPPATSNTQANTGPDPVIQLLATRASNDPNLKSLMRIVASGQATPEQLAAFQAHIDELTPLARASAAAKAQRAAQSPQSPQSPVSGSTSPSAQSPPPPPAHKPSPAPARPVYQPIQPAGPVPATPAAAPQILQPVTPRQPIQVVPKPKQLSVADRKHLDIKDVVFEFTISALGDRYLIPRKSILEYRQKGNQVLVSYLYISDADKTFQPITITINAPTPKIIEPISRVVEKADDVRAYMKDIMERYTRANHGFLLMQLKRDKAEIQAAEEEEARRLKEEEEIKKRLAKAATAAAAAAEEALYLDILRKDPPPTHAAIPKPTTLKSKTGKRVSLPFDDSGNIALELTPKQKLKTKYSRAGRIADPTKECHLCHTHNTSLWRRAEIDGETFVVCNACGIKWKTNQDKKLRGEAMVEYGPDMRRITKKDRDGPSGIKTGKKASNKSGRLIQQMTEGVLRMETGSFGDSMGTSMSSVISDTVTLSGTHPLTPDPATQQ